MILNVALGFQVLACFAFFTGEADGGLLFSYWGFVLVGVHFFSETGKIPPCPADVIFRSGRAPMQLAYSWTCDHCGRDSFVRCISMYLQGEELVQQARNAGVIQSWQGEDDLPAGLTVVRKTYPIHVTCAHCGSHYLTEEPDAIPPTASDPDDCRNREPD